MANLLFQSALPDPALRGMYLIDSGHIYRFVTFAMFSIVLFDVFICIFRVYMSRNGWFTKNPVGAFVQNLLDAIILASVRSFIF